MKSLERGLIRSPHSTARMKKFLQGQKDGHGMPFAHAGVMKLPGSLCLLTKTGLSRGDAKMAFIGGASMPLSSHQNYMKIPLGISWDINGE